MRRQFSIVRKIEALAVLLLLLPVLSCAQKPERADISALREGARNRPELPKNDIRFAPYVQPVPGETVDVVNGAGQAGSVVSNMEIAQHRTQPLPANEATGKSTGQSEQELAQLLKTLNQSANPAYRIHRGDVMEIAIPFEPESSRVVTVRPDGNISYLYDIDIPAAGLTYPELVETLKKELRTYYYNPGVSVNSKLFSGSQVYVMGPVDRPGPVPVQNSSRLLEVLATAGVLKLLPKDQVVSYSNANVTNDVIDLRNAYMMRDGQILPIDFHRLLMQRDMRFNIFVRPDDFIFFPSSYLSDVTKRVYVCGAVAVPRVYTFTTYGTFMSAVANSSGIEKYRADGNNCLIIRKDSGGIIRVNYNDIVSGTTPDIPLQDSDIVFIPERGLYATSRWTTTVINEIVAPLRSLIQSDTTVKGLNMQNWSPASNLGPVDGLMWQ